MANNNVKKQVHVSPGIYFTESEIKAATTSLGITNLGVAGETLKGPAFQVIDVKSWSQYQSYFGGTSTEKFKGSQYPKYELPYIAKTYLEESQNLKVCRVLGLSGVNAGPAWIISAYKKDNDDPDAKYTNETPMVVAVLRSRGEHKRAVAVPGTETDECGPQYRFDGIEYYAKNVVIIPSKELELEGDCTKGWNSNTKSFDISSINYGTFTLKVQLDANGEEFKTYSVSLNPSDKNYIYNVLGSKAEVGDAEIYVEELYDVALRQLIESGDINTLGVSDSDDTLRLATFKQFNVVPKYAPVKGILDTEEALLKKSNVGARYLYSEEMSVVEGTQISVENGSKTGKNGEIYVVKSKKDSEGKRYYYYTLADTIQESGPKTTDIDNTVEEAVFCKSENVYYCMFVTGVGETPELRTIDLDLNNYKSQFRYASTPWIVSELKGSAEHVELTKLFRFHTISDGNTANTEVKVSIENIDTEALTFDVVIRDFYDTDYSPVVLERYKNCNLVPGTPNYISLKIGSFDEKYETVSNYVTVEVIENDITKNCVPAGFLGFPIRNWASDTYNTENIENCTLQKPELQYNTVVDEDVRIKKQYFGMSDLMGIDDDILKFKGVEAYDDRPEGLTPCFHLDSRIFNGTPNEDGVIVEDTISQIVTVDGVKGYSWITVSKSNTVGTNNVEPRIGTEEEMIDSIYEDKRYRKFTTCFYGGWDGWDYYRTSRSNSDDFKYINYKGSINKTSGEGSNFSMIAEPELYNFDPTEKVMTSDWYAYMAAIRQFANPKAVDINVFATPGIDYVNNKGLVTDTIEMIEEERADSIYVITTPDKPFGASDSILDMYTAAEAVDNLEESEIDSNWACTYYPWVKYYDSSNAQYIYLPLTKDVVKNFAYTDNVANPWYAPAGWNRGLTDGVRSKKNLVLAEQDELYSGRINYVNNFAEEGMRIWGDKNLQVDSESVLNRISKRRALIRLRKLISIACIGLVFEPNDATLSSSLRSAIQPIIEDFVAGRAFSDAFLKIDDSQESRDRLELNADIYIKFTPNAEYINIGLIATPSGVSFDDI